ncbi:MAG: hypothetical protein A2231_10060 [Candidatus Firestonebacteria bacterium RIFOXYA2_FULL_40_8]|nr:MAG: hypothetical protein A2231_10060 [Candidatus Firestonebacteria bacterium RIFOXYA2_FULL_40_8]
MKSIVKVMLTAGAVMFVLISSMAARDKMDVIKIDKGDLFETRPDDVVKCSLSKEHAAKGSMFTNKIEGPAEPLTDPAQIDAAGKGGTFKYKLTSRKDWSEYDLLKFTIFNPSDKPISCTVAIWDDEAKAKSAYGNYYSKGYTFQPGLMEYEIDIIGIAARHGRAMNTKSMEVIAFYDLQPCPWTVFISNVHLAKEGDDSKDKKESKKEEPKKKEKK